ncbi:MAG: SUMF1/EgtB/PvdO family nonheme iron enzyme [Desulfobacterales bacterium]
MKRCIGFALVLLVALLVTSPDVSAKKRGMSVRLVSPSGEQVKGNQWLFVIGINTYIEWPRLRGAVADAKSVRDVLVSRYHYTEDHVVELYDEQATRRNIFRKFRYLARKVKKDDSLVIFYAGHGHIDPITKEGSWVPIESSTTDPSAWVTNHDIKNYLKVDAIKAKHILLISDSCFAGDFFRGKRGKMPEVTEKVIRRAYELTSRQVITSGGLEPVVDAGFGENSIFTHFLIRALQENKKPFLVPSELFPDIKAGVAENAEQFPRFGTLTGTGGQQGGELVFFLKQSSRAAELTAETLERSEELERLKRMVEEDVRARQREAAEIVKREKEVVALDAQIAAIRERLGTSAARSDDNLDTMLAMVKRKEVQQRGIFDLKKQSDVKEANRNAEIERLREQKRKRLIVGVEDDIYKYERIASSPFGDEMKEAAWKTLVAKYPQAKGIAVGDTERLMRAAVYGPKKVNSIGMEFVLIPPGTFAMGSPADEIGRYSDERHHRVTLTNGFYLQTTEVTQKQWQAVMGENPSYFRTCGDRCPVESVSLNDVQDFIRKLNQSEGADRYRLPTEAEWEYAARARTTTRFNFGDADTWLSEYGWYAKNSGGKIHAVGQKKPNIWGLYDMHGNVGEWCQDRFGRYPLDSVTNPSGPSKGSNRVIRGGSWYYGPRYIRSANRGRGSPGSRSEDVGFRLLKTQ